MALITDQLKTFAHKRPQQLQAVNIAEVLNTVLEMFSTQIQQLKVQLQRDHSGEAAQALWVWADQPRVEQVLINLIRNALDALQDLPVRELIISTRRQQAHIEIDVADSGPGLTQPVLDHLFDPFFTTKDIGQGLGLGLSISYGIVRDLEGSIRASNRPEGGALFRLQLPVATTESFDS
jgi:two-component system C4-dicarboxylate transport sensor histidine kinase DctB